MVSNANNPKLKRNKSAVGCRVVAYCNDVINGRILAGKWVRLACERHLADLESGHLRGLWWDDEAANHAIGFFAFLKHSKGRFNRTVFELSPWQAFIVGSLFGWKRANGLRRFRIAFVELPRKNGKTTLAAGIALYLFLCDGEAGAEVFSAATKRDQAKLVFSEAKALLGSCPDMAKHVEIYTHYLEIPGLRSKFEALGADHDTLDGLNPFVAICDEIHAWRSRDLWDVLLTGMGARDQPLVFAITTAGDFEDSIYNTLHNDAEQILDGVHAVDGVRDDETFCFIACADAEDDWTSETAWKKANPNLGVSLDIDELRSVVERAKRQPSSQNKIKRNRVGIRTNALNAWLRLDMWDKSGKPFDEAELLGKPCWGGLDLSSTQDLTAFALAFPWGQHRGQTIYRLKVWVWCPNETTDFASEALRRRLYPWATAGHVEFTEGETTDLCLIEETVERAATLYDMQAVSFDPWNAEAIAQSLTKKGHKVYKFIQNPAVYNEPTRAFERAVMDGRIWHNNHPVLRWSAGNCTVAQNAAGCIMPSKKRSRGKIDPIIASVMAVGCHMRIGAPELESMYATQGFDA